MLDCERFQGQVRSGGPPSRLLLSDYLSTHQHARRREDNTENRREVPVDPSNLDQNTKLDVLCRARITVAMQSGVLAFTGPDPCRGSKLRVCISGTSIVRGSKLPPSLDKTRPIS